MLKAGDPMLEAQCWRPEAGGPMLEDFGWRPEAGGLRLEAGHTNERQAFDVLTGLKGGGL